jgi:lactate dehydrogenase-like 2-hydroxyacid dehydrogenase
MHRKAAKPSLKAAKESPMKVAILDDFQNVALRLADWSAVARHAEITVFNDHVADPAAVIKRLNPFEVVCVMRERTPLPREILQQLPRLKLIASTGPRNASIDMKATAELGILVTPTGYEATPTIELTWALILAPAPATWSWKQDRCAVVAGKPGSAQAFAPNVWAWWDWAILARKLPKSGPPSV